MREVSGLCRPLLSCTTSSLLCHGISADERFRWKLDSGWQLRCLLARALAHLSVCSLAGSHARSLVCLPSRPPTRSLACSLAWPPACPSAASDLYTTWLPACTGVHVSDMALITRPPTLLCFVHTDHQAAGIVWPLASMSTYSLTADLKQCRASIRQHHGPCHGPVSEHSYLEFLFADPAFEGSLDTQSKASCMMDRLSCQPYPCCFVVTCLYICWDNVSRCLPLMAPKWVPLLRPSLEPPKYVPPLLVDIFCGTCFDSQKWTHFGVRPCPFCVGPVLASKMDPFWGPPLPVLQ